MDLMLIMETVLDVMETVMVSSGICWILLKGCYLADGEQYNTITFKTSGFQDSLELS